MNASFRKQRLPTLWKRAGICPLPKKKVVENLRKDLRPISLTSCISKVAEDFVVRDYLKPAILKIVGYISLTVSSNLTWNAHVRDVVKKASKRIYFLIQLKKANVSYDNLKLFYITCIRSILDYAVPVFHYSLPKYLMNEMERIQKRVMGVIFPDLEYSRALDRLCIDHHDVHHKTLCQSLFKSISINENHCLHCVLPPTYDSQYNLRQTRKCFKKRF